MGNERLLGDASHISRDFVLTPAPETRFPKALSEEETKAHDMRCAADDAIRLAHTATFRFNEQAEVDSYISTLRRKGLSVESAGFLKGLLAESLSGGRSVEAFLNEVEPEHLELAVQLLKEIRIKDIHEITQDVYMDYLNGVIRLGKVYQDTPEFRQSVLNPRFSNEIPIAYKAQLWQLLTKHGMESAGANEAALSAVRAIMDKVLLVDGAEVNPRGFFMTPVSVAEFGMADEANYLVLARALLSTAGVPNRINSQTRHLQIYRNNGWEDFDLFAIEVTIESIDESEMAQLTINDPEGHREGRNYTIQRWNAGVYEAVEGFNRYRTTREFGATRQHLLLPGQYRIVTGIRAADGSMLTRIMSFDLHKGDQRTIDVEWYEVEQDELVVIGNMDAEWTYTEELANGELEQTSILNSVGRNFFVLAVLEPTKEPSQHFVRELSAVGDALKLPTIIMFNNQDDMQFFHKQDYRLKEDLNYGFDSEGIIMKGLAQSLKATDLQARLPVVVVADSFGNIFYQSIGYNIGVPKAIIDLNLPIHTE